jgi:hypothetical protein
MRDEVTRCAVLSSLSNKSVVEPLAMLGTQNLIARNVFWE